MPDSNWWDASPILAPAAASVPQPTIADVPISAVGSPAAQADQPDQFDYSLWWQEFWAAVMVQAAELERATQAAADARLHALPSPSAAIH